MGSSLQAAVDSEHQVVLAMKVTNAENDHGQLADMCSEVSSNCGMSAVMALADTGYCDEPTMVALEEIQQEALIPLGKHPSNSKDNDLFASCCFLEDFERNVLICPAGRELSYSGKYQCGSGKYNLYSAHGCEDCSFSKSMCKIWSGKQTCFNKL